METHPANGNGAAVSPVNAALKLFSGAVADDWEAIELWLITVGEKSKGTTQQTIATYRFHLAKLRWFCEYIKKITPSQWTFEDAIDFESFLAQLPIEA